jgi:hypothetical protein
MKRQSNVLFKDFTQINKAMKKIAFILLLVSALQVRAQHAITGNTVVIIDMHTPYPELILSGLKPGSKVVALDDTKEPLASIHQIIKDNQPVSSLHIFSQGKPGQLIFSSGIITEKTILSHEEIIGSWKTYFTLHGDILLYGCEVGKGHRGLNFIRDIAVMTGLDIAASDNLTGSVLKGGDWYFEIRSGRIESSMIVSKRVIQQYPVVLRNGLVKNYKNTM